jgi:DNA-binding helix-hairpin-helix protein with protein kinase domain
LIKKLHPDRQRQDMSEDERRQSEDQLRLAMEAFRILRDGAFPYKHVYLQANNDAAMMTLET